MKISKLRTLTALVFILLVVAGILFKTGFGSFSSFGYEKIAEICPLGSLEAMLASHTFIPRAIAGFLGFLIVVVLLGRFFCGWICPVPLIRRTFGKEDAGKPEPHADATARTAFPQTAPLPAASIQAQASQVAADASQAIAPQNPGNEAKAASGRKVSPEKLEKAGPYIVLGGALLSTALFSFPVFCLICPVGLTFALIISVWHLFQFNEPSLTILLFLFLLLLEIFVIRKWCHQFCPLGALMSLMSRLNFTFRPKVDAGKCLRSTDRINCTNCRTACSEGIDLHGKITSGVMSRCLKCHKCSDSCPAKAISFPFLKLKQEKAKAAATEIPARKDPAKLQAGERRDFKEVSAMYTEKEAIAQAQRCVGCRSCVNACPLHNDIPDWMHSLAEGDIREAGERMFKPGLLPEFCSRICPQDRLCESACPMAAKGGAVPIGSLGVFVSTKTVRSGLKPAHKSLRHAAKVAVIGAGPSGLSCADALAKKGYKVTLYDDHPTIGGLLTYGIPAFKLDKKLITQRIKYYKKLGVSFMSGVTVGKDVSLEKLLSEFDAVYMSTGAEEPVKLLLEGAESKDVLTWKEFLQGEAEAEIADPKGVREDARVKGRKVVVLGGGDTAMDCVRTSLRLAAERVTCLVRKPEPALRASRKEYKYALEEGAKFIFSAQAEELLFAEDRRLAGVRMRTPEGIEDIEAELLIVAYGARPVKKDWASSQGVTFDEQNRVVNYQGEFPGQTANPKIFAGGDLTRGANLAVYAVKDGIAAATSIDCYLTKAGKKQS